MKSKNLTGKAPGGKRTALAKALPLSAPFVVQIFPMYACTFKCNYCIFQLDVSRRGFISDKTVMDLGLYKKCVDEMSKFPEKIKTLRFVGIGEPLLHPDIVEMVRYTVLKGIADKVEILTNGFLLSEKMSDNLIRAGLSRLVVSLQGTSGEKYKKICQTDIDFEKFVQNIRYFYENRGKSHVYLKIVDSALDGPSDEKKFYKIFGDISDSLAVEYTVPIHSNVNYDKIIKNKQNHLTQFGLPVLDLKVCPQPFFTMQINPDGKVVPCYSFEYPEIIADCNNESVFEIWNGKKFTSFRMKMLDGLKKASPACKECSISRYRIFEEDILDNDIKRLKEVYKI